MAFPRDARVLAVLSVLALVLGAFFLVSSAVLPAAIAVVAFVLLVVATAHAYVRPTERIVPEDEDDLGGAGGI